MATKLIIKCKKCSEEFSIYWNNAKHEPISCPNCFSELNDNLSEQVLNALGIVHDVNHEIYKESSEFGEPLFEVSVFHSTYPVSD